jgi:hypothetical protein
MPTEIKHIYTGTCGNQGLRNMGIPPAVVASAVDDNNYRGYGIIGQPGLIKQIEVTGTFENAFIIVHD